MEVRLGNKVEIFLRPMVLAFNELAAKHIHIDLIVNEVISGTIDREGPRGRTEL